MFLFTVPYLKITRLPVEEKPELTEETNYNWSDAGIMIVEDDPASITFLKEVFKNTGVRLFHACNGIEAVTLFRQNECIDLVIMDIQLPEMDGYEATRLIKSINGKIPVIAQTAFAMSGDREKMTLAGFDDYLSKPVNISRLLAMVDHWLTSARSGVKPKLTSVMHPPSHSDIGYLKN